MQGTADSSSKSISNGPYRWYCYSPEDVPMTYQVALVGKDGIVLGSDMKMNRLPSEEDQDNRGVSWSTQVSKIFRNSLRGVMACWSGSDPAMEVAKKVVELPDADIQNPDAINDLANRIFAAESEWLVRANLKWEVILVAKRDVTSFHWIRVQEKTTSWPVYKAITGNSSNAATYFIERFYEPKKFLVAQLIPLVAHAILEAGRINPLGVGGLEIVCCSKDGLQPVPENRISKLTNLSERVEGEIKALLYRSQ